MAWEMSILHSMYPYACFAFNVGQMVSITTRGRVMNAKHFLGMVQAWVGHFVTPITPSQGYSLVLVYVQQVTTTRRDQNTQHKDLTNTITMVVEPPTP